MGLKHGGPTTIDNFALCCRVCNGHKGSDLASLDAETGELCRLFHLHRDLSEEHFSFRVAEIWPVTPVGRVMVRLLKLNSPERIQERALVLEAGEALR